MKIEIREAVRCWGHETSIYDVDLTMDEVRQKVSEEELIPVSEVSDNMVASWISENYFSESCEFQMEEVLDRDSAEFIVDISS